MWSSITLRRVWWGGNSPGLSDKLGALVDSNSAVGAEGGSCLDGAAAGEARSVGGRWRLVGEAAGGADLSGDVGGLTRVVTADAAGHKEGLDPAEGGGDSGPGEEQVKGSETIAAEVEVMDSKGAEEDCEEDSDGLVAAGMLVFGEEPGALVVGHSCGVDGFGEGHGLAPVAVKYGQAAPAVPFLPIADSVRLDSVLFMD